MVVWWTDWLIVRLIDWSIDWLRLYEKKFYFKPKKRKEYLFNKTYLIAFLNTPFGYFDFASIIHAYWCVFHHRADVYHMCIILFTVQLQIEDYSKKLRTGDLGIPANLEERFVARVFLLPESLRRNTRRQGTDFSILMGDQPQSPADSSSPSG